MFTCYLAASLPSVLEVPQVQPPPPPPISPLGLPLEMEYADDVDFIDEEKYPLDDLLSTAAEQFKNENLFMNEAKTEFTHVHLSDTQEVDEDGVALCGNDKWRRSKILGSLLCSLSDITAHCITGNISFQSYWKLWIRGSKIPLTTKIRLYDATCVSQMLYNCNSWVDPKKFLDKLDACHCRHLHTITGHRWPDNVISNNALYKMCNVVPLSVRVNQQR